MDQNNVKTLAIKPLTQLLFKPPSPFTAGIFGPAAIGTTLSYPYPSTISGLLASILYFQQYDTTTTSYECEDYRDVKELLEYTIIRPGFLKISDKEDYNIYLNRDVFPKTTTLVEKIKQVIKKEQNGVNGKTLEDIHKEITSLTETANGAILAHRSRISGVALNRSSKSVKTGYLYQLERIEYEPWNTQLTIYTKNLKLPDKKYYVKLGGKQGTAILEIQRTDKEMSPFIYYQEQNTMRWLGILISPALIRINEQSLQTLKEQLKYDTFIPNSKKLSKALGKLLLNETKPDIEASVIYVPKGESSLGIVNPGWCTARNIPREPYLLIPSGTVLEIDGLDRKRVEDLAWQGLGASGKLGWGTTILIEI
ncbi:MAG: hypothetical protein F7B59_01225 [Desulfurococcales archaeon]|nr:hypothetical protein [Desulfurococcales archaeon]